MSGPKDKDINLEGVDWDEALAEWEEKTFLPETAKDRETQKPATLQGTPAPPSIAPSALATPAPPAFAPSGPPPSLSGAPGSVAPPSKPLYVPPSIAVKSVRVETPARGVELPMMPDEEEESNATVIAQIPRELLRKGSAPPRSGGGLGQMFAKPGTDRPAADMENAPTVTGFDPPPTHPPESGGQDDVVTSAQAMESLRTTRGVSSAPPRVRKKRRPSEDPPPPEGETLDPFAEPDPFAPARASKRPSGRATRPADTEVLSDGESEGEIDSDSPYLEATFDQAGGSEIDALLGEDLGESLGEDPDSIAIDVSPGPPLHQPDRRVFDADTETSAHVRGAIHAPSSREYDPNEETSVLSKAAFRAKMEEAADEEGADPTRLHGREEAPQRTTQSWENEKPAQESLDEATRAGFIERAAWLEAEGRAAEDRGARARTLLAASELRAIVGDVEAAEMLAREAAASAPTLAMPPRQARALSPSPRDPAALADALDAEARQSPTQAAMLHDALLAGDVLRFGGDIEGAAKRWDRAIRIAPADPRAPLARAAERLGRGDVLHPTLRLPDAVEIAPLAGAFARVLKIRGVERRDVSTDEPSANDALRRAREAIGAGRLGLAATAIAEVGRLPELREAASWLAGTLGAATAAGREESVDALRMVSKSPAARRALAARALEIGAPDVVEEAIADAPRASFGPADRAVLAFLAGVPRASSEEDMDALAESPDLAPLAAALSALSPRKRRAERVVGTGRARDMARLGRLLGADAVPTAIEDALEPFAGDHDGETRAIALEMAARAGRVGDVSDAIAGWTGEDEDGARDRSLAAALVAERAGDPARAAAAYASAFALEPNEASLRALASLDPMVDMIAKLRTLGETRVEGAAAAMPRLEAVARGGVDLDDATRDALLDEAHRAAPWIPIASFLAERSARRAGDEAAVLRWLRDRRAAVAAQPDPIEEALDLVREALLIADTDAAMATMLLAEAHRARPDDVALRELYERVATVPPSDSAAWREKRAAAATAPATRARLFLEAMHAHERAGDAQAALRCAEAAHAAGGDGLARLALERAELEAGTASRLADGLLALARSTEDPRERREAYERLADLDATGRDDAASALLWHKTILEAQPDSLPSLRYVEHALLSDARVDELEPVAAGIARALAATGGGAETASHAQLAARLRARAGAGAWDSLRPLVELAASTPEPSLWALRALAAHARASNDDAALARATLALAERSANPAVTSALLVRAGEAVMRAGDLQRARELLERAGTEDPGDVVTWGLLAEIRQRLGDARGAAEACESLARTSVVDEHRLLAWYDAGRLWLDEADDAERGIAAFEQAAAIDVGFQDVFGRLSALYTRRGARHELASLLERRIASATDDDDRVHLEVDRARALLEVGEAQDARRALEQALELRPDHVLALGAFADLCASTKDWDAAEQAWVRLARLVPDPIDQRAVYARLGELYSEHSVNLSRAEVALREVLKRAPDDAPTLERLVTVYKRQGDGPRALETAQQLLAMATEPEERLQRLVEIASIHETVTRELRKAEQALEAARREFPGDVGALRALAEFYQRQRQLPAVNILLDRASADARRALTGGRFSPSLFQVLETVFELRGKRDAAQVVAASLAALEGKATTVKGMGGRAGDRRLDDLLAPEALGPGLRSLLAHAGNALDAASALDLRALHAAPLSPGVALSRVTAIATSLGLAPPQVLMSPQLGRTCVPSTSSPAAVVLGEPLLAIITEPASAFTVTRALKLVQAHASALVRTPPNDLAVLVAAWIQALNPSWRPEGIAPAALAEASRRIQAGLPRNLDPETATIALEVAGTLGPHLASLGATTIAWADRAALLAVGDPNAALDAIAWSLGMNEGAPEEPSRRASWVLHTAEARDLLVFSTSDAFAEARTRAGAPG